MLDLDAQLDAIDAGMLAPVVREVLNRDGVTPGNWSYTPLIHGVVNPVTAGLYRFSGTAHEDEELLSWSAILKILRWVDLSGTPLADGYMDEPGDWNYWKREALVFQSGILDDWKGALVPVRCYAVVEYSDDCVWLWLEDVRDPPGTTWPVERHILAARHFGQFNGAYCRERPIPDFPWLCRNFMRQWVRTGLAFGVMDMATDPDFWEHPLVRRAFPTPIAGRASKLLRDAEDLLACLERQPQTLSHLDTHCVNLFARVGDQGQEQTIVIDWSFLGIAAPGEDVGMQISGNLNRLNVDPACAQPYYEGALDAYVAGLRDAGWRGTSEAVRFASATAAALRLVPFGLEMLRELFSEEGPSWADRLAMEQSCTVEEVLPRWGQAVIFLLDLAEQAGQLADQI